MLIRLHRAAYGRIVSTNRRGGGVRAYVSIAFQQRRKAPQPLSSDSSPQRGISPAMDSRDRCDCGTPGGLRETETTRNSLINCRGRFARLATRSTLVSCSAEFEGFDSVSLSVTDCVGANSGVPRLAGSSASSMARHASTSLCRTHARRAQRAARVGRLVDFAVPEFFMKGCRATGIVLTLLKQSANQGSHLKYCRTQSSRQFRNSRHFTPLPLAMP